MSETPFFYFYFTTGGRPRKLSACSNKQKGRVKVDLVLATLETKHDLNALKNQQQQQHRRVERNPGRQDDGEGDQQQQQQQLEPMSARGDDQLDQKNVKLLVHKAHRREGEGAQSGSSGGRTRPVCVDESSAPPRDADADADDAEFIPRNNGRDRQHTAPAHTHSNGEDQSHGSKSSKKRLKRLLDSSSDEEGG